MGFERLLLVAAATLGFGAVPAQAGCVPALIVEERLLLGTGSPDPGGPGAAGYVDAADPVCDDTGDSGRPDTRVSVQRLKGVPPRVGVLHDGSLYVEPGALVAVRGHPLREAAPAGHTAPSRGRCRPHAQPLRGRAASEPQGFRLAIDGGRGERQVSIDGRTRVAGAPPEQPVVRGQRLVLTTSLCGGERFADTITFEPPILESERREPDFGATPDFRRGAPALLLLLLVAGLATWRIRRA